MEEQYTLGDTRIASEIGKPGRGYYSWVECPVCAEQRWAPKRSIPATRRMCKDCTLNNAKSNLKIGKDVAPTKQYNVHGRGDTNQNDLQ